MFQSYLSKQPKGTGQSSLSYSMKMAIETPEKLSDSGLMLLLVYGTESIKGTVQLF